MKKEIEAMAVEVGYEASPEPVVPFVPPKPKIVNEVDRLRSRVLHLEAEKVGMEITMLTQRVTELVRERNERVKALEALRVEFLDKYGIDLWKGRIQDDGSFVLSPTQPSGS